MKLKNPFPPFVRMLYFGWWECFLCKENGQSKGGLEIHHILGRVSDSAFNSSCLCKECHAKISHNQEEHREIFAHTLDFLYQMKYRPNEQDIEFIRTNYFELISPETERSIYTKYGL